MQAKDVIERARIILQDAGADYWASTELPKWLTDGRLEAYTLRPDLYQQSMTMTLAQGPEQTLPNGSRRLFDVPRNVSHPDARQVTLVAPDTLARHRPTWRSSAAGTEILHFLYDVTTPAVFEVYPPAQAGTQVEISYAKLPDAVTDAESTADLAEEGEYAPALVDYVLYRAFLKEADTVPASFDRATQHYAKFRAALAAPQGEAPAPQPANG